MTNLRIGHGYDVHRLTEGRALILGGVTPVESLAGTMVVVRGVTTRTKTGEASDETLGVSFMASTVVRQAGSVVGFCQGWLILP